MRVITRRSRAHRRAAAQERRYLVVGSSLHFTSGISFHTLRLTNALARRHPVSAVLMRELVPRRFYPGRTRVGMEVTEHGYDASVDLFDGVNWYWIPSIFGGVATLLRHRPDVVIFHWWTGAVAHSYLLLAAMSRLIGARVVFELHELQDPGEAQLPLAGAYVRTIWRLLDPLVDAFVIHSNADRLPVTERFRTRDRPVTVIPVGSYDHYGDLATTQPRREAPPEACNLLFFGTIRPYKGLEDLVEAFNSLTAEQAAGLWLTVVGETWEGWTRPAELIAQSPHRDRITFVNTYVTDAEVAGYLAGADIAVLPYHRSSASGPLHVVMSAGLPVVVTSVGGLTEAAGEYRGAVFAPPRDPQALLEAITEARKLVGQRFDDPHSWEHAVDCYDALADSLDLRHAHPVEAQTIARQ